MSQHDYGPVTAYAYAVEHGFFEGTESEWVQMIADTTDNAQAALVSAGAAAVSATEAESYAKGNTSSRTGENTDNAKYFKEQAANSATAAAGSASAAASDASDAEAYAKGTRDGVTISDTDDPAYHNSAAYHAGLAADSATAAAGSAGDASDAKTAAQSAASAAVASVSLASTYDNTQTYAVGDYCLYDGALYRCKTAISTAESWTPGHWEAAKIGDDVSELKDKVKDAPRIEESLSLGIDLDVADSYGNVITRFANGHIMTKEFSSLETIQELSNKQDALTFDDVPTSGSNNPVKSSGVYSALASKQDVLVLDDAPTSGSNNPIKSGAVYSALENFSGGASSGSSDSSVVVKNSTVANVDLDISDTQGNVIMRLKNGEIYTKYFHSDLNSSGSSGVSAVTPTVITLKSDGTGDFSTLKAAVDSIIDADAETNPYEIHVYPGTYDTLSGFTSSEISAADIGTGSYTDQSMVGIKLTDGVSLIGVGDRDTIILTAELDPNVYSAAVRGNISTLNLKGTNRLENVTVKAKSLRYCVHDDFEFPKRYTRIVKNCAFIPVGRNLSYNPANTYGAGIRVAGMDALFENCDFGYSFSYHTRENMTGNSVLILRNCTGLGMRVGDSCNESDTAHHTFILDSCNFNAVVIKRKKATTPHVKVIGVNNPNTMLFCLAEDRPHFADELKASVSNLPVGTLVKVNSGGMTVQSGGITAERASSIYSAIGIIVDKDDYFDYIQTNGYLQGSRLGLSGLAVGDFITVDANMKAVAGGTSSNAIGVVKYTDSDDNSQIWMMRR